MNFEELGLRPELLQAVNNLGFISPMPIQEQVIPLMLNDNSDLVGLAQTGTGKTAAYGLPILNLIDTSKRAIQALILAPTRELCVQISKDMQSFALFMPDVKVVPIYGGESIITQFKELDIQPQILVATPGRLIDLINRGKLSLSNVDFLVLDEADEMLNMGFVEDIETILHGVPDNRRTLLFSATMPTEIANIAKTYMKNYREIVVGTRNSGAENVDHFYYMVQAKNRYLALKRIVDYNPDIYGIIFCRTREETKDVAQKLMEDGYNADALHGDLSQAQRDLVMNKFRMHNLQLLVATDVAARGLDVSDLTHIINYNLPDENEIYIHRSGRTGRANKSGVSISIIHSREGHRIKELQKITKKEFTRLIVPSGLEICKKQLYFLIDKMENVQVNEEQIEPYLPHIFQKLDYLSKEDIVRRFVSLEFNRFLDYYKDSEDINIIDKPKDSRDDRKRGENGKNSRDKNRNNNNFDDNNNWKDYSNDDKYQHKSSGKRKSDSSSHNNKVRMKINIGNPDKITPKNILGIINGITDDRSISISNIEVTEKTSFFDVYADQADKLISAFKDNNNRGFHIDFVNEERYRSLPDDNDRHSHNFSQRNHRDNKRHSDNPDHDHKERKRNERRTDKKSKKSKDNKKGKHK